MAKLFAYSVKIDQGLAPNPFWGYCTLACSKPEVRKNSNVGDWVVGVSPTSQGSKIIYAMKVMEKITFNEYFHDERFQRKKPVFGFGIKKEKSVGDNFYEYKGTRYVARESVPGNQDRVSKQNKRNYDYDQKCEHVLISAENDFYYFGSQPLPLSENLAALAVGKVCKNSYTPEFISEFEAFIAGYKKGICAYPEKWNKVSSDPGSFLKLLPDYD